MTDLISDYLGTIVGSIGVGLLWFIGIRAFNVGQFVSSVKNRLTGLETRMGKLEKALQESIDHQKKALDHFKQRDENMAKRESEFMEWRRGWMEERDRQERERNALVGDYIERTEVLELRVMGHAKRTD